MKFKVSGQKEGDKTEQWVPAVCLPQASDSLDPSPCGGPSESKGSKQEVVPGPEVISALCCLPSLGANPYTFEFSLATNPRKAK